MLRNVLSLFQMTSSVFFKMFDKIKLARYFCKTKWGSRKGRTNLSCLFSSSKRNTSRIYWSLPAKEACRAILIENLLLWFYFFIFAKVLFHLLKRPWIINFSAAIYPNWLPRLKERVTNIFTLLDPSRPRSDEINSGLIIRFSLHRTTPVCTPRWDYVL